MAKRTNYWSVVGTSLKDTIAEGVRRILIILITHMAHMVEGAQKIPTMEKERNTEQ